MKITIALNGIVFFHLRKSNNNKKTVIASLHIAQISIFQILKCETVWTYTHSFYLAVRYTIKTSTSWLAKGNKIRTLRKIQYFGRM